MLLRCLELHSLVPSLELPEIDALLLKEQLYSEKDLCEELENLRTITKKLQNAYITVIDAQTMFDAILSKHQSVSTLADRLQVNAKLIENPTFEISYVKGQSQKKRKLSPTGQKCIQFLLKLVLQMKHVSRTQHLSIADRILKRLCKE